MAAEMGSDPLSGAQLDMAEALAESLVAYREQVRTLSNFALQSDTLMS